MRFSLFLLFFWTLSLCVVCPYSIYAGDELPFPVLVMPSEPIDGVDLTWDYLFFNEPYSTPSQVHAFGPFHGSLSPTPEGFHYSAQPSLWQAKVDTFVLDYQQDGVRRTMNVAIVVGSAHHGDSRLNTFDVPINANHEWDLQDPLGAMLTDQRVWIPGWVTQDTFVFASAEDLVTDGPWPGDVYEAVETHAGSTTTGLGGGVLMDPPPDPFQRPDGLAKGLGVSSANAPGHVFFAAGAAVDPSSASVFGYLELDGEHRRAWVGAYDENGTLFQSPEVDLPTDRQILLEVESDDSEFGMEVARLLIDGVRVAHTEGFEAGHRVEELREHQFGVMDISAAGATELSLDTAEIYYYRVHGEEEPRRVDDFGPGDALALRWDGLVGGGLALVPRLELGMAWLRANLALGDSYLVDALPEAEPWARMRFDIDPSQLDGLPLDVMAVYDSDLPTDSSKHIQVSVRNHDVDGPQVRAAAKGTVWRYTPWYPLSKDRPSQIDLTFKQASFASTDGELVLRVDGLEMDAIRNMINGSRTVDTIHFGAVRTDPSSNGRLYFDNYQVWVPHGEDP